MAQTKVYCQDAEWFDRDWTPTYVNANSFTVTGDRTGTLVAGRALKLYDASTIHRFVQSASFTAVTTIALESGTAITSSLTSFAVAALNPVAPSNPQIPVVSIKIGVPQSVSNGTIVIYQGSGAGAVISNTFSWYDRTTGRFSPQWAGWYQINALGDITGLPTLNQGVRMEALKNGATAGGVLGPRYVLGGTAGGTALVSTFVNGAVLMNGSSDYVTINHFNDAGGVEVYSSQSYIQAYYLGK